MDTSQNLRAANYLERSDHLETRSWGTDQLSQRILRVVSFGCGGRLCVHWMQAQGNARIPLPETGQKMEIIY